MAARPHANHAAPDRRPTLIRDLLERPVVVLAAAVAIEVLLLAALPRFVTVDGAIHVGGAALLRDLLTGAGAVHLHYVELTPLPVPNLTPELVLAAAMLIVDPLTAEKLLIIGYVVALPLALLYAVDASLAPGRRWLALAALPLTFTFTFHYGFLNFSYGVAAFLVVAGFALRMRRRPTWRGAAALGLLLLLTYSCHIVPFVEAVLFVGVVAGTDVLTSLRGPGPERRSARRFALGSIAAVLPSGLLALGFFLATRSAEAGQYRPILEPLLALFAFVWPLLTFDLREAAFTAGLAAVIGIAALWALWQRRRLGRGVLESDAVALFAVLALVAFVVSPASVASGGNLLLERLGLFPIYGAVLWLALQPAPSLPLLGARVVGVASLVAAVGLLVVRWPSYVALADRSIDYLSVAPCIAPGATMVQSNLSQFVPGSFHRLDPLVEETGVLSATTRGHDLGNIEGAVPFYPIRNHAWNDPYVHLRSSPNWPWQIPPDMDPLGYEQRTDGRVDYILLYGRRDASPEVLADPRWVALQGQLDRGYRLVATSPAGHLEVFERDVPRVRALGDGVRAANAGTCASLVAPG